MSGQTTVVKGRVLDKKTWQSIPFANIQFTGTSVGAIADTSGDFQLITTKKVTDIKVSFIGYQNKIVPIESGKKNNLTIYLEEQGVELSGVEIKYKGNPAEMLIDSVRKYRLENDMKRRASYETEAYVKTKFSLYKISEKFKNNDFFKPFRFMFENPDTVNGELYYPFLMVETLSDIYDKFGLEPREYIKATKLSGIENLNYTSLLGSVYNEFNFYDDNQLLFNKTFVGPISPIGITYYKYYLTDSTFKDNHWCYKVEFKPRLPNENVYIGHVWIHDSSYAIQSIHLKMNDKSNINVIGHFLVDARFKQLNNGHWVLEQENAQIDLDPRDLIDFSMGFAKPKENFWISVQKISSFNNYKVNQPQSEIFNKFADDIEMAADISKDNSYWEKNRHDTLSSTEKNIYTKVDSVKKTPWFKFLYKVGDLAGSGYVDFNYVAIGQVFEFWGMNTVEGHRIKFGGRTGDKLSKRWMMDAHIIYGTKDQQFKWDFWGTYHFNKRKNPWRMIGIKAKMDVEQLGVSAKQHQPPNAIDNLLGSFARRRILRDLSYVHEVQLYYEHDWFSGLNQKLSFTWSRVFDTGTMRFGELNPIAGNVAEYLPSITKSEIRLETTFAYGQKFLTGRSKRRAIRSKYPTIKFIYATSIKGLLGGNYTYHNFRLSIRDRIRIKPLGYADYEIAAGKILGKIPYSLMEIHLGNDTYIYDQFAFNLMNFFEFVSDQWVSVSYEHHFEGFFFNKIPILRKMKLREVVGVRAIMGSISEENKRYMALPSQVKELKDPLTGLNIPYVEMNVGIDNIFNMFRIDFLWRFTHNRQADPNVPGKFINPDAVNWGIMGGININI
jgi:hypothetical protein